MAGKLRLELGTHKPEVDRYKSSFLIVNKLLNIVETHRAQLK